MDWLRGMAALEVVAVTFCLLLLVLSFSSYCRSGVKLRHVDSEDEEEEEEEDGESVVEAMISQMSAQPYTSVVSIHPSCHSISIPLPFFVLAPVRQFAFSSA